MNKLNKERLITVTAMILGAAAARLLPHPPGVAPITAMAVFGGMHYRHGWAAYALPLGAMFLSDCFLGFHALMPVVYGSFALIVAIAASQKKPTLLRASLTTVCGSVLFYLTTNFAMWVISDVYPKTPEGLLMCYVMGLPFLRNGLLGDLAYCGLLFGVFALLEQRYPKLREAAPATV
ncbi:MAG: hypothetical protein N3B01_02125 [Verrucomicrobiae bacterium]|nr:hypothetical protein [Verrucomicrobiae bacterium]